MARPPRPERKAELLEQILDFLLDSTLADLTFRSLADGLGISSYVLVYHFGNRDALVTEIIRGIMGRFDALDRAAAGRSGADGLVAWARESFAANLDHRGRHLQRLEFEASVQDAVAREPRGLGAEVYELWCRFLAAWLEVHGMDACRAGVVGRAYVGSIMGLLYDFVITGDRDAALESFDVIAESFLARVGAEVRQRSSS